MVAGEEGPVFSWTAGSGFPLLLDPVEVLPGAGEGNKPILGCAWSFSLLKLRIFMNFPRMELPLQQEKHHLDDLKGLFQLKGFYNSVIPRSLGR